MKRTHLIDVALALTVGGVGLASVAAAQSSARAHVLDTGARQLVAGP